MFSFGKEYLQETSLPRAACLMITVWQFVDSYSKTVSSIVSCSQFAYSKISSSKVRILGPNCSLAQVCMRQGWVAADFDVAYFSVTYKSG